MNRDRSRLAPTLASPRFGDDAATFAQTGSGLQAGREPAVNAISASLLLAIVVLAPLPYGSVGPAAILAWCTTLAFALLLASLHGIDGRHLLVLGWIGLLIVAYALVVHEQISAHPFLTASQSDPVWQTASEALGTQLRPSVSMIRDQPLLAVGAPLAAVLSLLVGFIVCINREQAHRLIHVVAWSGTAYAIYGIVSLMIDPSRVLWMKKEAYFTVLTATFINRNTAAIYFGSCTILWLLILAERLRRQLSGDASFSLGTLARPLRRLERRTMIEFAALFACLTAMFLTGSRAGVVLSLLAAIIALGLFVLKAVSPGRKSIRLALAAACCAVVEIQLLGAGVLGRFDSEGLDGGGRRETYRATLTMIEDHPWLGTGLGTFAWVFPAYRGKEGTSWGTWDRAHSTPLEIAAEMGLPLAAIVITSWLGAFAILLFGIWNRNRDHIVVIAALAVGGLGCLHSLVDFSMQIPGLSIIVLALVGAGLAQSFRNSAPG